MKAVIKVTNLSANGNLMRPDEKLKLITIIIMVFRTNLFVLLSPPHVSFSVPDFIAHTGSALSLDSIKLNKEVRKISSL